MRELILVGALGFVPQRVFISFHPLQVQAGPGEWLGCDGEPSLRRDRGHLYS